MIKVARIKENAKLPTRKFPTDAGMDLYACVSVNGYEHMLIPPNSFGIVPTGIKLEVPNGWCAQVWPKGGSKHLVGAGIVDAGYQGEVLVKVFNVSRESMKVSNGDAIAQLVLVPILSDGTIKEVAETELYESKTERSNTGGIVTEFEFINNP